MIDNNGSHNVNTQILSNTSLPDSTLLNNNVSNSGIPSNSINLNYNKKLGSEKKGELNIDLDYTSYNSDNWQELRTTSFDNQDIEKYFATSQIISNQDIDIKSAKVDYSQKLKENTKLEGGVKWSEISTDNDVQYRDLLEGNYINDPSKSNHFKYKETTKSAYLSFNTQIKSFEVQLGIRAEDTKTKGISQDL